MLFVAEKKGDYVWTFEPSGVNFKKYNYETSWRYAMLQKPWNNRPKTARNAVVAGAPPQITPGELSVIPQTPLPTEPPIVKPLTSPLVLQVYSNQMFQYPPESWIFVSVVLIAVEQDCYFYTSRQYGVLAMVAEKLNWQDIINCRTSLGLSVGM
jgi:hypothetical protein